MDLPKGVTLIGAIGKSGQLGLNNKLPWPHDAEDMKWFRQVTMEADLIIGGYLTVIPGKLILKNRHVEVDIRDITPLQFLQLHDAVNKKVVVIGGARTYERWMDIARTILITKINYDGPADTWMGPLWKDD